MDYAFMITANIIRICSDIVLLYKTMAGARSSTPCWELECHYRGKSDLDAVLFGDISGRRQRYILTDWPFRNSSEDYIDLHIKQSKMVR
jgi:hypothetical protein